MANEIYDSTWWGNTIDTASSIGTSTEMIQGQINMNKLGDDLVVNGNFATDTNWSGVGSNGFSISGGKLNLSDVAYAKTVAQDNVTVVGKTYKVTFLISDYVEGSVRIFLGGSVTPTQSSNGVFTSYVVASANTAVGIQTLDGGGTTLSIDNVSVKQVRAYRPIEELVKNGDFATDSDWVLNDWNISEGLLNGSASTGIVFQNNLGVTIGKTYKATLEVSNYVSGAIRFKLGGSSYQNIASTNGVQEFYFTASTTDNNILFSVISAYTGSIDNVSVKQVRATTSRSK